MPEKTGSKCCVCGMRDARGLTEATLPSKTRVTLCGSHELMMRRSGIRFTSAEELERTFGERRETTRRARARDENRDELAEKLSAAFTRERRGTERRAS